MNFFVPCTSGLATTTLGIRSRRATPNNAVAASQPVMNVWFDVATNVTPRNPEGNVAFMVARMRQAGVARLRYGSDMAIGANVPAAESWKSDC